MNEFKKIKWKLFLMGVFKIPMIGYVRPQLISINDEVVQIKVKHKRRTKNHLNSLYMGALVVGADIAGGIMAFYFSEKYKRQISFSFKNIQGDFLKRATTDVLFKCSDGKLIENMILQCIEENQRLNQKVSVLAYDTSNEIIATFEMTFSLKVI